MTDPVHYLVVTPAGKITVLDYAFHYAQEGPGLKGQVTDVLTAPGYIGDMLFVTAPSPDGAFSITYLDDPTAPENRYATTMAIQMRAPKETLIRGNAVFLSESDAILLNDSEVALLRMLHSAVADTL